MVDKKVLAGLGIVVLIIAGLIFFAPKQEGRLIIPLTAFVGGMTVNSVSSTNIISNDADIDKTNFIVTATVTGSHEELVGTLIDDSQFENIGFGSYDVQYPLEISVKSYDENARYRIKNDAQPFWIYTDSLLSYTLIAPSCPSGTDIFYDESTGIASGVRHCWKKTQRGSFGHLEAPDIKYNAQIQMKVGSDTVFGNISNQQSSVDFFSAGKFVANAQTNGLLLTGDSGPTESAYWSLYSEEQKRWNTILRFDKDTYDNDLITTENKISECNKYPYSINPSLRRNCIEPKLLDFASKTSILSRRDVPIQDKDSQKTLFSTYDKRDQKDGASLLINLDRKLANPQITFKIIASWLGVRVSVGKPEIVSVLCPSTVESGNRADISVTVKNSGSAQATFEASVTGGKVLTQSFSGIRESFGAGETKTMKISIDSGLSTTSGTDELKIKISDVSKPSNFAETTSICSYSPPLLCEEGEQISDLATNSIFECKDGKFQKLQLCADNERPEKQIDGTYGCIAIVTTGVGGLPSGGGCIGEGQALGIGQKCCSDLTPSGDSIIPFTDIGKTCEKQSLLDMILANIHWLLLPLGALFGYAFIKTDKIIGASIGLILGLFSALIAGWILANPLISGLGILGVFIVFIVFFGPTIGVLNALSGFMKSRN